MSLDSVTVTLSIPRWAGDLIYEDNDINAELSCDELYFDDGRGTYILIEEQCQGANSETEVWLKTHGVPFDKWFDAGIEWTSGKEWVRFVEKDGEEVQLLHREVYDDEKPDFDRLFKKLAEEIERDGNSRHALNMANERFVRACQSWWDDKKPFQPEITETKPTRQFKHRMGDKWKEID